MLPSQAAVIPHTTLDQILSLYIFAITVFDDL